MYMNLKPNKNKIISFNTTTIGTPPPPPLIKGRGWNLLKIVLLEGGGYEISC